MLNPYSVQNQQLQLLRQQQLINQGEQKGGYFEQMGAGGGVPMDPMQAMRQQLIWGNLQNPNQIQGAANNAGLLLGQAIGRVFGPKNQEQVPPEAKDEMIRMESAKAYAGLIKKGLTPDKALYQVATDNLKRGADTGELGYVSAGQRMLGEYRDLAKDLKTINEFTPVAMKDKDGHEILATSKDQVNTLAQAGFSTMGDRAATPAYMERTRHEGTEIVNEVSYDGGNKWKEIGRGTPSQLTGPIPKRQDEYTDALATTNSMIDSIDQIQSRLKDSNVSGTKWGRNIVQFASGISGTIQALAPDMDPSVSDISQYQDVLGGKKGAIEAAGLTEASLIRLATLQAAQQRAASGEANRTSVADVKLKLQGMGANLSDPKAFAAVLEDVKQESVRQLGNKIDADTSFDKAPFAKGVRTRYDKIKDRVKTMEQPSTVSADRKEELRQRYQKK